jgi:hypothetical protein
MPRLGAVQRFNQPGASIDIEQGRDQFEVDMVPWPRTPRFVLPTRLGYSC